MTALDPTNGDNTNIRLLARDVETLEARVGQREDSSDNIKLKVEKYMLDAAEKWGRLDERMSSVKSSVRTVQWGMGLLIGVGLTILGMVIKR